MHATQRESPPSFATRSSLAEHNGAINYATLWAQLKPLLYASAITSRKREKWSCIGREFGKNAGLDRAAVHFPWSTGHPSSPVGGGLLLLLLRRRGRCQRWRHVLRNELYPTLLLYISLVEVAFAAILCLNFCFAIGEVLVVEIVY